MQKLLVVSLCLVLLVNGHAVLKSPRPWNTAASKASPCGGGTAQTAAAATWTVGSTVTLQWQVIASDGQGDIFVNINTAGGTSFSGTGTKIGTTNAVSTRSFNFVVPNVQCGSGGTGLCNVQIKSSGWVSCTTVKINAAAAATSAAATSRAASSAAATSRAASSAVAATSRAASSAVAATSRAATSAAATTVASTKTDSTEAPPTNPDDGSNIQSVCDVVTGLTFCTVVNGNNVTTTTGQTAEQIDKTAESTFQETIKNENVFSTPDAAGCAEAFKQWTCASAFTLCKAEVPCQPNCLDVLAKCGVQDSHKGLFDCNLGSATECLVAVKDPQGNTNQQEQQESDAVKILTVSTILLALLL